MVEVLAAAAGRTVHLVGDGAYVCTELRQLPPNATLTGPIPRHASLWHIHPDLDSPPRLRRRGRPRVYGTRMGTPAELAATTPVTSVPVTRYGRTTTVAVHHQRCLWRGVFGARPVRVLVIIEPGRPTIALVTTDPTTPIAVIVERYAARWSIEVAFHEAKNTTGIGEARNRTQQAVERTVPFGLLAQSIVIIWYHLAGHHPTVIRDRRHHAPTHPSRNPCRDVGLGAGSRVSAKVEFILRRMDEAAGVSRRDAEPWKGLSQTLHSSLTPAGQIEQASKVGDGFNQPRKGWRRVVVVVGVVLLALSAAAVLFLWIYGAAATR